MRCGPLLPSVVWRPFLVCARPAQTRRRRGQAPSGAGPGSVSRDSVGGRRARASTAPADRAWRRRGGGSEGRRRASHARARRATRARGSKAGQRVTRRRCRGPRARPGGHGGHCAPRGPRPHRGSRAPTFKGRPRRGGVATLNIVSANERHSAHARCSPTGRRKCEGALPPRAPGKTARRPDALAPPMRRSPARRAPANLLGNERALREPECPACGRGCWRSTGNLETQKNMCCARASTTHPPCACGCRQRRCRNANPRSV